ncbi:X-linked interleukin-1 receptor accessory protein-like 2 [Liparis tanakae]|uniref:X-linked interleukin-1 receptor accessory protein-like 2 n=1 Tax=Liparis tanakae TaxID=230148 RepID=A0A4Z2GEP6_9TELE|nr:X-linked interleukin-1 receptor accessory protein-like 2 [Liparis tanakae]
MKLREMNRFSNRLAEVVRRLMRLHLAITSMPLSLDCKAFFGYSGENRRPIVYWMKGEKFVEELAGHIKESEVR